MQFYKIKYLFCLIEYRQERNDVVRKKMAMLGNERERERERERKRERERER
jgi:hypothetical protein